MKYYQTPVLLLSDAYTIGSEILESSDCLEYSKYYITARKFPYAKEPNVFRKDDQRIVFCGISAVIDKIFNHPITHDDIDETKKFLEKRKFSTAGLQDFNFPEKIFRRVVDECGGYMPLKITALPEGSVAYPHEPLICIENTIPGFGQLAAYWEAPIINYVWSQTARLTTARHWLERCVEYIMANEGCSYETALPLAQQQVHDFGCRAHSCIEEAESLGMIHTLCFGGTDTFQGAYQSWKNEAPSYIGGSVDALAHRIVQGFDIERDCYENMYDKAHNGAILSAVADCYSFHNAVEKYLIPLAERSVKENNGKIVVIRPDSDDCLAQILWALKILESKNLFTVGANGLKYGTACRFIQGDSMTFDRINNFNNMILKNGWAPHGIIIYGIGGHLRNGINRDDFSMKYALCSKASTQQPVIKLSETPGKSTLPSSIVLRTPEALSSGVTIDLDLLSNKDNSAHVTYYENKPLPIVITETFPIVQSRVLNDFRTMPLTGGKLTQDIYLVKEFLKEKYTYA